MSRLAYFIALGSGTALALTGLLGWLDDGLRHWKLAIHMVAAPILLVSVLVVAVVWAGRKLSALQRLSYWAVLSGIVVGAVAMLLAMLPHFGQDTLHLLFDIHRGAAVAIAIGTALHFVALLANRRRARHSSTSVSSEDRPDVSTADA